LHPAFAGFFPAHSPLARRLRSPLQSAPGIGAVNLVLALKKSFLKQVYWLNINELSMPFLALVEHTNYQDPARYGGDRLLYIGNYLPADHAFFRRTPANWSAYLPRI